MARPCVTKHRAYLETMDEETMQMNLIWTELKERERSLILSVSKRLLAGQREYGGLTFKKKMWIKEAKEELLDATVYMAACLLDAEEQEENDAGNLGG